MHVLSFIYLNNGVREIRVKYHYHLPSSEAQNEKTQPKGFSQAASLLSQPAERRTENNNEIIYFSCKALKRMVAFVFMKTFRYYL